MHDLHEISLADISNVTVLGPKILLLILLDGGYRSVVEKASLEMY